MLIHWTFLQIKHYTEGDAKDQGLEEGDVLVTNHPQLAGGSHLPDITVITPVFNEGKIVFFVASRGHHADVGGITPGSMPPHSHCLAEEGAAILSFKVVNDGVFQVRLFPWPSFSPGCCFVRCKPVHSVPSQLSVKKTKVESEIAYPSALKSVGQIECIPSLKEGCINSTILMSNEVLLQTQGITDLLMAPAKLKDKIPNISGTRNLSDNISDLKAQVAANNRGISLVKELIKEYSLEIVQAYMTFIQVCTDSHFYSLQQAFEIEKTPYSTLTSRI